MTTPAHQPQPAGLRLVPRMEPGPGPASAQDLECTLDDLLSEVAVLQCRLATMPTIEQAKGALMAIYGLTDQAAFDLLRWHSQQSNIKLRDLAARLTAALPLRRHRHPGRHPDGPTTRRHHQRRSTIDRRSLLTITSRRPS